ncbi:hypothetical protein N7452_009946 [Penicillium brevicompactum]|uniref:Uncharacterized protein n=1 Tax=Penicillium brevicompactum TaxID=5074 RepID=A0A9W9UAR6_PENBR|nr:hypothetical protein N7452_009946 [Penicillium brevicompactum]
MGWDRVIQDSDEDEPIEGDDLPRPVAPPKHPEPAVQQYHDHVPAEDTTHSANEHGFAPEESTFPQLSVNFDEFLQSQERNHAGQSSSQQRREERWIPNTEGASGSAGGSGTMMSEIGLAQRRLLDDNASVVGQQVPSAGVSYSADSIQSAPFPTIPSSHSYQMGPPDGEHFPYYQTSYDAYTNGNQALPLNRMTVYESNPQNATNGIAPFPDGISPNPQNLGCNIKLQTSVQPSEPKSISLGTNLISQQQSQTSAHDELALPAPTVAQPPAVVEPPAKKKRGRPKKQALPIHDEDDELANSRDHEFKNPGANGAIDPSDSEDTTENDTPASSGVSEESDEEDIGTNTPREEAKEPKKKRAKKAKTAPAPIPDSDDDDNVIWIDTKPINPEIANENADPNKGENTSKQDPNNKASVEQPPDIQPAQPTTSSAVSADQKAPQAEDKPAPKKRGRKRKQPVDQEEVSKTTDTDTTEPANAGAQTPGSKLAVLVDNSPKSASETDAQANVPAKEPTQDTIPAPAPTLSTTASVESPQTPCKPDAGPVNTPKNAGKGLEKHSPISARGGVPYRVGLSKRARIAPLLKMVRK